MKIIKVRIRNFRSIKDETLFFPENGMVAMIGSNNAGKSNFLRAIDLVLGDQWMTEGRLENYYFYCDHRDNEICIKIFFDDQKIEKFVFGKNEDDYKFQIKYKGTEKMYFLSNEAKDKFPCTYLSAERNINKDISFNKWSLMSKVSKSFNSSFKQSGKEQELHEHFLKVKELFDSINSFKRFQDDFKQFFAEMQSGSPYKLKVDFKPFTPNNYFKTINILANDPSCSETDFDLEELGDGAKTLVILALLRSYAKHFREPVAYLPLKSQKYTYIPKLVAISFRLSKKSLKILKGKFRLFILLMTRLF